MTHRMFMGATVALTVAVVCAATMHGCCYTHTGSRGEFTQVAVFNNIEQVPGSYKQTVSSDCVRVAGLTAAAYIQSALAAVGIALPDVTRAIVDTVKTPADNLTTTTAVAGKGSTQ